jgi:FlaA1/EpsC-like NDP-sugar epimerase
MSPSLSHRRLIALAYDFAVVALAWWASYFVAFGMTLPVEARVEMFRTFPVVAAIQLGCFAFFRLYRGMWRFASLHDFKQIAKAVGAAALLQTAVLFIWNRGFLVPRSALVLDPLLVTMLMCGGRMTYRWWKEQWPANAEAPKGKPVLILGAGESAFKLVLQLQRSPAWQIVGLLDDDRAKVGRQISGHQVLGTWDDIGKASLATGARHAMLAVGDADHLVRRRAFELCDKAGVKLQIVPDIDALMTEGIHLSNIRNIEVDDLLRRDPVKLDVTGLRQLLTLRTVLVTGAGGSIGSELCRQIARFKPRQLVLVELSEYALYQILETLQRDFPELKVAPVIADVKDQRRLFDVFARYSPEIVFHAAAYKHVPLMETGNSWQAVQNNTLGTVRLMETVERFPVERLVFISTDKAVNPTSVMGATKRLSEMLLQEWSVRNPQTTTVTVRFGNVLGSTGSVVPKFKEQIARGGPITITDPAMRRYFMSVPEAAQLVLQAARMGNGGEIFVLDMGEPILIADLARDMIRLSGLSEDEIAIEYTGLRPGEKLFEELLANDEATLPTRHRKLRVARPFESPGPVWEKQVLAWLTESSNLLDADVRAGLARFVPEYQPYQDPGAKVITLHPGASSRLSA